MINQNTLRHRINTLTRNMLTILCAAIGCIAAYGQPTNTLSKTNGLLLTVIPPAVTNQPASELETVSKQLASASGAMSSFFETKQDPVDDETSIDQIDYDDCGDGISVELYCNLKPKDLAPAVIELHIFSRSQDWQFLDNNDVIIRGDDIKRDYGNMKDYSKVLDDGVSEQFFVPLKLEDLRRYAWSNDLWFRLGYQNVNISYSDRQKWKLLWKYFDLRKKEDALSQQAPDSDKNINISP